jgi:predicted carbohydrate-binding protein with CBM5 and CBM33 domain
MYQWPTALAQQINAATPPMMRAGEMQADGSIQLINGSSYRNQIWVQLGQSSQLAVTIETRDANGNLIH